MAVVVILVTGALWNWAQAGYIHLKARVAGHLLERAWAKTLRGEQDVRPWPWADTRPVARLRVPGHRFDHTVLDGADGGTLAFAPGRMKPGVETEGRGTQVIAGHRDTHFRFLENLGEDDKLEIQDAAGAWRTYRVDRMEVADSRSTALRLDDADRLVLVTCYPFDAILPGGPLRYVVSASGAGAGDAPTPRDTPDRG